MMPLKLYDLTDGDIQLEAEAELARRLKFSSLSHVILFTIVLLSTPLLENQFQLTLFVGTGLVLTSLLRFFLGLRQQKFYPRNRKIWLFFFDISLVTTACLWGIFCEEIIRHEGFTSSLAAITFLITSGITAGASNSLNPSFKRGVVFIALTLGIPFGFLISSAIAHTPLGSAFTAIFLVYFAFLSMQIRSQYEIFWNLLRSKKEIIEMNHTLDEKVRERTKQLIITEAKLIESAKMAALGEMAGGIAHEINTPLGVIALKAQQASELVNDSVIDIQAIGKVMQTINDTVIRISKIISGLRTFSRDAGLDQATYISAKQIIHDTLGLCLQRLEFAKIEVRVKPIEDDLEIYCRSVQISQVLLNLILNACDAIDDLPHKWIEISVQITSFGVEISVTDSGQGIPEATRVKVFQPFFTTKEIGKGTGLGLSISMGIMESHQGTLTLDHESENTRFVLFLPNAAPTKPDHNKKIA